VSGMGSGSAGGWTPAAVTLAAAAAAAAGAAITYCALAQRPAELAAPKRPPAPAAADRGGADCSCSVEVVEEAAPKVDPFDRRPRKGCAVPASALFEAAGSHACFTCPYDRRRCPGTCPGRTTLWRSHS